MDGQPGLSKFLQNAAITALTYTVFAIYSENYYIPASYASRYWSNVVLLPGAVILLWAYRRGYLLLRNQRIPVRWQLGAAVLVILAAFFVPPFYSADIYCYINGGWEQAKYGVNPYVILPVGCPGFGTDPMFSQVWALNPFPYGFLFAEIANFICRLGAGDLSHTVMLFKVLMLTAFAATGGIVYLGARKQKLPRPDLALYLFLWNPLLLIHTVSNAHNDILLGFLDAASLLFIMSDLFVVAVPLAVAAILIKYVSLICLPLKLIYLCKRSRALTTALALAAGILTAFVISRPYFHDWHVFQFAVLLQNLSINVNSLPAAMEQLLRPARSLLNPALRAAFDAAQTKIISGLKVSLLLALVMVVIAKMSALLRRPTFRILIQASLIVSMIAVHIVSGKFYPWYIAMYFPLALWLPASNVFRKIAIVLSCTQLFAFTFIGHGHLNNFLFLTALPLALFAIFNRRKLRFAPSQDK